jgi:citrate synthase
MKWRTKISVHKDGSLYLRGKKLTDLIGKASFPAVAFLAIQGKLPNENEEKMLNAILVAMIEHGVEVPSAFVPRTVASTGNPVNAALAAGILTIGEWHGGAIEAAMKLLSNETPASEIVRESQEKKTRISGYGHKIYKDEDPRAIALSKVATELGIGQTYLAKAREIEKELTAQTGKTLPLNVDGAVAAILLDLGFDWRLGKAFFAFSRMPGMMAHIQEEMTDEKPYRRFEEDDVEYLGNPIET